LKVGDNWGGVGPPETDGRSGRWVLGKGQRVRGHVTSKVMELVT